LCGAACARSRRTPFDEVPVEADYRERLALDSLDFLRLVELLSSRSGIRIEEADYPMLATIKSTVDFLTGPSAS
jgi:acyl carrier protein